MNLLNYLKKAVISTVLFFLFLLVLDLIFGHEIDHIGNAVQAIVIAFVVIPIADWISKKFKI